MTLKDFGNTSFVRLNECGTELICFLTQHLQIVTTPYILNKNRRTKERRTKVFHMKIYAMFKIYDLLHY